MATISELRPSLSPGCSGWLPESRLPRPDYARRDVCNRTARHLLPGFLASTTKPLLVADLSAKRAISSRADRSRNTVPPPRRVYSARDTALGGWQEGLNVRQCTSTPPRTS